jgi:hypothetical protein
MKRTLYQRIFDSKTAIIVKNVKAARAVFESQDIQRIDMTVVDEAGNRITFELKLMDAHRLIGELTTAYQSIHPPLASSGYGQHWGMQ